MPHIARRGLAGLTVAAAALAASKAPATAATTTSNTGLVDFTPVALPAQLPAQQAVAKLPNANLAYWDTQTGHEAIVLLHPATGSYLVWSYQQPVFAAAGYRTIGYSRRGFAGSDAGNGQGTDADDLRDLADHFGLTRFHLVATAAGAFTGLDFAVNHQDRLLSLTLACSITGSDGAGTGPARDRLRPKEANALPQSFMELSPSYRAANPDGMALWEELQRKSRSGPPAAGGAPNLASVTADKLRALRTPTLLIAGGADLIAPPPLMRALTTLIPRTTMRELPDTGHSAYWEQPREFNRLVLEFVKGRG